FAGSVTSLTSLPGAGAPCFTLMPASQARSRLPMPQTLHLRSDTTNDGHASVPQMAETPADKSLQRVRSVARTDNLVVDEIHREAHLVSDIASPALLSDQEQTAANLSCTGFRVGQTVQSSLPVRRFFPRT